MDGSHAMVKAHPWVEADHAFARLMRDRDIVASLAMFPTKCGLMGRG